MANYVAQATVTAKLTTGAVTELTTGRIDALIISASNEVDDLVGPGFARSYNSNTQKFPQITDSPATPATVELCALWLTLSRCYEELSDEVNFGNEENSRPAKIYYRDLADKRLTMIRNREITLNVEGIEAEVIEKYFDATVEDGMDHIFKKSDMDALWE